MADIEFANKAQEDFFFAPPGGVLGYYGGYGSGKSTALCLKLLWIADTFAGAQIALIRRTASQLRKTTLSTLLAWVPAHKIRRYNEQAGLLELVNGSKFFLLHLDTPDSLGVLKSLELTAAGVDQAEEVDVEAVDLLATRVGRWRGAKIPDGMLHDGWPWLDRTGAIVAPNWLLLTFNCPGFDSYLYARFAPDSPNRSEWAARGYRCITASSRDNRYLSKSNLDVLLAGGHEFVSRFVDVTSWGVTEGLVFDVPDMSILMPEPGLVEQIHRGMKLHRSLDHGETAPTCCLWFATDHDGRVFCHTPDTRVLTADLRHVPLSHVQVGDELAGFDENVPDETGKRRWRTSTVEHIELVEQPCIRVSFSDGTSMVVSEGHKWLGLQSRDDGWYESAVGRPVRRLTDVWDTDHSYEGGYLAAAFDGEGHYGINDRGTPRLGFTQNPNGMLSEVQRYLSRFGFYHQTYEYSRKATYTAILRKPDILRFLGSLRPKRLLSKFNLNSLGGLASRLDHPTIVSVEPVGIQTVVAIKTSTQTLVAEGLASHNCYREYYEAGLLVSEHRKNIVKLSALDRTAYYSNLADPSIFAKSRGRGANTGPRWSVSDEYGSTDVSDKETALYWTPAENDEMATRIRLKEYLKVDKAVKHPITGERGAPRLYFIKRTPDWPHGCDKAIMETRAQRYKGIGEASDGSKLYSEERDDTVPDHALDALRYFIVSRPAVGMAPVRPDAQPGDMYLDEYFERSEQQRQRRRRDERRRGVAGAGYGP